MQDAGREDLDPERDGEREEPADDADDSSPTAPPPLFGQFPQ